MVRLKQIQFFLEYLNEISLNSTMVRLKQLNKYQIYKGFNSLNSTMVRLKLVKNLLNLLSVQLSQFHYGSIKTDSAAVYRKADFLVSIPLWFD